MRIDVSSGQETEIAEHLVKKLEQMDLRLRGMRPGLRLAACAAIFWRFGKESGTVLSVSVPIWTVCRAALESNRWREDGILRSSGDTILAADDLSGVAAILEGVRQAIESGKALPKLEILYGRRGGRSVRCESIWM